MLVFLDSFDHYDDPNQKYSNAGASGIDLSGTKSRTGPGCCALLQYNGPWLVFQQLSALVCGLAWFSPGIASASSPQGIVYFFNGAMGLGGLQFGVAALGDCSVAFLQDGSHVTAQSAPGVLVPAVYNYVEVKVTFSHLAAGSVEIRVNGQSVLSLTNVVTGNSGVDWATALQLRGQGGGGTYIDDFYLCDLTGGVNDDFLGPVRIYCMLPSADAAPLDWTPSVAGPHYPLVNSVPVDQTTMVQDSTVADQDNYLYDAGAILPNMAIKAVQHSLFAQLDAAGAGSVESVVNGSLGSPAALTVDGHFFMSPWDVDPATGLTWSAAEMGTMTAGPVVAA
jgi:hypothetical protein